MPSQPKTKPGGPAMPAMSDLTERVRQHIQAELEREFPGDLMMQELHLFRRLRYEQVKHLPLREQLRQLPFGGVAPESQGTPAKG